MQPLDCGDPTEDWPVVGNKRATGMLRRAIQSGRVSHAYLFTGPDGVGKRTLAMAFAMALNCQADPPAGAAVRDVPCGLCSSCGRARHGDHPDLIQVDLETQAALLEGVGAGKQPPAKELRIGTIREMQHTVGLSPFMGRYKVCIIGDAGRLNDEASNALLKTLEEPPAHTVLVLLAPDVSSVLPTISSRCVQVPLRPVARAELADALERCWGADREQAEKLAALSGGRVGWAVNLLRDRSRLEHRARVLEEMALLTGSSVTDRINSATKYAKQFTDARQDLYEALDTWEGWWRDLLVTAVSASDLVINVDQLASLTSLARRVPAERAHKAIELIRATRQQLMENVNPRLALEALTLGLP